MNRRSFLQNTMLLAVLLPASSGLLHAAAPPVPNIHFILLDDAGAHLDCLGTPGLSTPQLDGLAKAGVLFRHYYVGYRQS